MVWEDGGSNPASYPMAVRSFPDPLNPFPELLLALPHQTKKLPAKRGQIYLLINQADFIAENAQPNAPPVTCRGVVRLSVQSLPDPLYPLSELLLALPHQAEKLPEPDQGVWRLIETADHLSHNALDGVVQKPVEGE